MPNGLFDGDSALVKKEKIFIPTRPPSQKIFSIFDRWRLLPSNIDRLFFLSVMALRFFLPKALFDGGKRPAFHARRDFFDGDGALLFLAQGGFLWAGGREKKPHRDISAAGKKMVEGGAFMGWAG